MNIHSFNWRHPSRFPDQLCVVPFLSNIHSPFSLILTYLNNFGRHVLHFVDFHHIIPSVGLRGKLIVGSVLILVVVSQTFGWL